MVGTRLTRAAPEIAVAQVLAEAECSGKRCRKARAEYEEDEKPGTTPPLPPGDRHLDSRFLSLFRLTSGCGISVHTRKHDALSRSSTSLVCHLFLSRRHGRHRGRAIVVWGPEVKTAVVRTTTVCEILNTPRLLARSAPIWMKKYRTDHVPVHDL